MKSDHIVFITGEFPPMGGGIARHLYTIVNQLAPQRTTTICLPTPKSLDFDRQHHFTVRRLRLPMKWDVGHPLFKLLAPAYFTRLVRVKNADIVLCGHAHHTLMIPCWLNWRIRNVPFGVFAHGLDVLRAQSMSHRKVFNSLLCSATVVIANSQSTAGIVQKVGVDPNKIFVVNPGIDSERLRSKTTAKTIRQQFGLTDKRIILSVGRLVERKGHDVVLKALPQVLQEIPEAHYLIVGSGTNETKLKILAKNLHVENNVTFVGQIQDDELGAFYAASDVFVMISREIPEKGDMEGFGIVYLEANSFGKPVIAGRSGGVEDAVIDGINGLLVDPNNPDQVSGAIIEILSNPALAQKLGDTGRTRTVNDFSSETCAQNLLKILESI